MHGVVREVKEERLLRVAFLQQIDGEVGQVVGEVGPLRHVRVVEVFDPPGREEAAAAVIDVETVLVRMEPFVAEMPFADMPR